MADKAGPHAESMSWTNKPIADVITVENKSRSAPKSEKINCQMKTLALGPLGTKYVQEVKLN